MFTEEHLAQLKEAYASGVMSISMADGRTVTYRSQTQLAAAIKAIEESLYGKRKRYFNASHQSGL